MDNGSAKFRRYTLDEIAHVYLGLCNLEKEREIILPRTVEGSEVHLFLGIKNNLLDPVLLRVLLSGVGVYLSPFTDI